MFVGYDEWASWKEKDSKPIYVNKHVDPMLCTMRGSGILIRNVVGYGVGYGLMMATAPISYPLLMSYQNKEKTQSN